jgi:hypothetical protein
MYLSTVLPVEPNGGEGVDRREALHLIHGGIHLPDEVVRPLVLGSQFLPHCQQVPQNEIMAAFRQKMGVLARDPIKKAKGFIF